MEPVIKFTYMYDAEKAVIKTEFSKEPPVVFTLNSVGEPVCDTSCGRVFTLIATRHGFARLFNWLLEFAASENPEDVFVRLTGGDELAPGSPDILFKFDPLLDKEISS